MIKYTTKRIQESSFSAVPVQQDDDVGPAEERVSDTGQRGTLWGRDINRRTQSTFYHQRKKRKKAVQNNAEFLDLRPEFRMSLILKKMISNREIPLHLFI